MMLPVRLLAALLVAAAVTACGAAPPSAPSPTSTLPTEEPHVVAVGNLTVTNCVPVGNGLFQCAYQGAATNTGLGCASQVTGTTSSFQPGSQTPLDAEAWSYGAGVMRPGDQIVYKGAALVVPSAAGWTYRTDFLDQNVRCP